MQHAIGRYGTYRVGDRFGHDIPCPAVEDAVCRGDVRIVTRNRKQTGGFLRQAHASLSSISSHQQGERVVTMNWKKHYMQWITCSELPLTVRQELEHANDLPDRFGGELVFGTGGLRGIMGAGSNRMNRYTVGKATQGLADYLNDMAQNPAVCIAYDSRHQSHAFARVAAEVLCANHIQVYLFDDVRPTPMLSYAVRHQKATAGIVITASHNPKEYNGYKVYGADGGQITDRMATSILKKISAVDIWKDVRRVPLDGNDLFFVMNEVIDAAYFEQIKSISCRPDWVRKQANSIRILYTPLHGTGSIPVPRALREMGYQQVDVVQAQRVPDGSFPTVDCPNPEDRSVFYLAESDAQAFHPDLILATDPDCDRIGVMVQDHCGAFGMLTGNQVGVLLCDYILAAKTASGSLPQNAAVVQTIVSTPMTIPICNFYGVALVETLTGFKYIGEKISEWEQDVKHSFAFGFEESYGYLAGNFVRDKDAVMTAVLIAEMVLWYKQQGKTLHDRLQALWEQFGYYQEKLLTVTVSGTNETEQIIRIVEQLRSQYTNYFDQEGVSVAYLEDYQHSCRKNCRTGEQHQILLPKSNVLKFIFEDDSFFAVRPSGTEPKIKIYLSARGLSGQETDHRLQGLENIVTALFSVTK